MGYHQRYSGIYSTMVWKKSRCFYWKGTDWVSYCHYLQGTPGTPKINEPWFIHPRLALYQIHLDMGCGYNAVLTIDSIYNFRGYFYPQVFFMIVMMFGCVWEWRTWSLHGDTIGICCGIFFGGVVHQQSETWNLCLKSGYTPRTLIW